MSELESGVCCNCGIPYDISKEELEEGKRCDTPGCGQVLGSCQM